MKRSILVGLVGCGVLAAATTSTQANQPADSPETRTVLTRGTGETSPAAQALVTDLTTYAASEGLSLEGLLATSSGFEEFSAFMHRLEEVADSEIIWHGTGGIETDADYWILLSSKPSDHIIQEARALPVDIEFRYREQLDENEQATVLSAILNHLSKNGVRAISGYFCTPDAEQITIEYTQEDADEHPDLASVFEEARAVAQEAAGAKTLPPIEFVVASGGPATLAANVEAAELLGLNMSTARGRYAARQALKAALTDTVCT